MYLSRVFLNPQRRATREWVASPQKMHAAILYGFAEQSAENRPLWRLDRGSHRLELYTVSANQPDHTHLVESGGWSTSPAGVLDYRAFLDTIEVGRQYRFRLRANTVKSTKAKVGPGERGRVVNVGSREAQEAWLLERCGALGFSIPQDAGDVTSESGEMFARRNLALTARETLRFGKLSADKRLQVTLATAQFDGVLKVEDVALLERALTAGIGRGKAYGCGLLTLAPMI
ncbi:MAG: type I-E CRISPR-associated protein Cas6/Cse3/CasE [Micropruina sp.]|nr:type I-E CRISPR-associated protein Cas6/Cse3/CasE [Micropruina sp.]